MVEEEQAVPLDMANHGTFECKSASSYGSPTRWIQGFKPRFCMLSNSSGMLKVTCMNALISGSAGGAMF